MAGKGLDRSEDRPVNIVKVLTISPGREGQYKKNNLKKIFFTIDKLDKSCYNKNGGGVSGLLSRPGLKTGLSAGLYYVWPQIGLALSGAKHLVEFAADSRKSRRTEDIGDDGSHLVSPPFNIYSIPHR